MKKRCSKCRQYKKLHLFYKHKQCKDDLRPDCKLCYIKANKKLYRKKKMHIMITYTKTEKSNRKQDRKFHIDHCHKTKKVRGLLCHNCNIGLGHLKDNIKLIKRAEKYLKGELPCQK